jgi:hypothetical protein
MVQRLQGQGLQELLMLQKLQRVQKVQRVQPVWQLLVE